MVYTFRWESALQSRSILCGGRSRPPHPATGALTAPEPHESEALYQGDLRLGVPVLHQDTTLSARACTRAVQRFIQDARADAGFILYILRHRIWQMTDPIEIDTVPVVGRGYYACPWLMLCVARSQAGGQRWMPTPAEMRVATPLLRAYLLVQRMQQRQVMAFGARLEI
jgi:hypothetical protein